MFLLRLIWAVVHARFAMRADLVAENLALRQQLIVRGTRHPCSSLHERRIRRRDTGDRTGSSFR